MYTQRRKSRDVTTVDSNVEYKSGVANAGRAVANLQVKAMWDYVARDTDELTFKEGDIVQKVEKISPEWWQGELRGKVGLFPANYVVPVTSSVAARPVVAAPKEKAVTISVTVRIHLSGKPSARTLLVDGVSKGSELIDDIFECLKEIPAFERAKYQVLLSSDNQPIDKQLEIMKQPRMKAAFERSGAIDILVTLPPSAASTPVAPVAKTPQPSSTSSLLQKYLQPSSSSSSSSSPLSSSPSPSSRYLGSGPSSSTRTDNLLCKSPFSSNPAIQRLEGNRPKADSVSSSGPSSASKTPAQPSLLKTNSATSVTSQAPISAASQSQVVSPRTIAQPASEPALRPKTSNIDLSTIQLSVNATNPNAGSCAIAGCAFRRLKQVGSIPVIFCKKHATQYAEVDVIELLRYAPTS